MTIFDVVWVMKNTEQNIPCPSMCAVNEIDFNQVATNFIFIPKLIFAIQLQEISNL